MSGGSPPTSDAKTNLGESIRRGTAWVFSGSLIGRMLDFAAGIVLARLLVPADFGMLVTISIFTGIAGFFAGGGMGEALVQAKDIDEKDYRVVFTIQFLICVFIYLGFFAVAPWFAVWFEHVLYADLLRVSALSFLIRPFANIPISRLRREMRFKTITVTRLASITIGAAASILMALNDMGPWALVLGGLAGALANTALLYFVTRWRPGMRLEASATRRLGSYGIKFSANDIVFYLRSQTSNLVISRVLGPSMVGLFNKADSLSGLPAQAITASAYQPVFRALSNVQDNLDQSKYIYFRTITLITVYTLPFYVGLLWLAEPFIVTVYGQKWVHSAVPLQILALSGLFQCVMNPAGAVAAAQNRLGQELRIQIEAWGILAVGCMVGIHWGVVGVAWGVLPSFGYLALRMCWLANECINGSFPKLVQALIPALILNAGLAVTLLVTHLLLPEGLASRHPSIYLLTMSAVGALAYAVSFLYAPIRDLAAEAMRWRRMLRLAPEQAD